MTLNYSYIKASNLYHDMTTAWCENGAQFEHGLVHKNLVSMIDVTVTLEIVDVEIKGNLKI